MTALSDIRDHELHLACRCGHLSDVAVRRLLALDHPPVTLADALVRMRCAECGRRERPDIRIVWAAGSAAFVAAPTHSQHYPSSHRA
jgi:hypothetical protein